MDEHEDPVGPAKSSAPKWILLALLGVVLVWLAGDLMAQSDDTAGFSLVPAAIDHRAARAKMVQEVDGLRNAEKAYDAAFDNFVFVPKPFPRSKGSLNDHAVDWTSQTQFESLGWKPDSPVKGTYWIEPNGNYDFTIHGMTDLDADGNQAHATATKNSSARLITSDNVY